VTVEEKKRDEDEEEEKRACVTFQFSESYTYANIAL